MQVKYKRKGSKQNTSDRRGCERRKEPWEQKIGWKHEVNLVIPGWDDQKAKLNSSLLLDPYVCNRHMWVLLWDGLNWKKHQPTRLWQTLSETLTGSCSNLCRAIWLVITNQTHPRKSTHCDQEKWQKAPTEGSIEKPEFLLQNLISGDSVELARYKMWWNRSEGFRDLWRSRYSWYSSHSP